MRFAAALGVTAVLATGCAAAPSPEPPAPPSAPEKPASEVTVQSESALRWTRIHEGVLDSGSWSVTESVGAGLYARLVSHGAEQRVRLIRLSSGGELQELAFPPPHGGWPPNISISAENRSLRSDTPRVISFTPEALFVLSIEDSGDLFRGRIDLAGRKWTQSSRFPNARALGIEWAGRVPDGWLLAGYRWREAGRRGDVIAWWLPDDAVQWPQPERLSDIPAAHQYGTVQGYTADDGSALIFARTPDGSASRIEGYAWQQGRFRSLPPPFPLHGADMPVAKRTRSRWIIEHLVGEKTLVLLDDHAASPRALDATPTGIHRRRAIVELVGDNLVVWGGDQDAGATRRPGLNPVQFALDGILYDLRSLAWRAIAAPTLTGINELAWRPELPLSVGGNLCIWGGVVTDLSGIAAGGILRGGACLDVDTLQWQWRREEGRIRGGACRSVGHADAETAVVACSAREVHVIPANWEWPERQVWGPEVWSIWQVQLR